LIGGGGGLTDAVRRMQKVHGFENETAHWMCVAALSVTAQLLARLMLWEKVAKSLREALELSRSGAAVVLDPGDFLRQVEPSAPGRALPHDWTATTDSIAARVAAICGAGELVLLKSADPPPADTLAELAWTGYVDEHFPLAANALAAVRLVNLRSETFCESLVPAR
jgi:dihydroneopterin aldolase